MAVVKRLPKYHHCLGELMREDVERVSSRELSDLLGFTASQIRQDLNNFGEFGQQGYGYNVQQLYRAIAKILGLDKMHKVIVIGAGKLGQAIANYEGFEHHGFKIVALFDVDPKIVGLKVREIPIYDVGDLTYYINENSVDIAILTVPKDKAEEVANILYDTSIKGVWNFSPIDLKDTNDVKVENVHLIDSLMTLNYRTNETKLQKRAERLKREREQKAFHN